jgi:hypothetical protein
VTHTVAWALGVLAAATGIATVLVKTGKWIASVEDRLNRHDTDLSRLGKAEAALEHEHDQP